MEECQPKTVEWWETESEKAWLELDMAQDAEARHAAFSFVVIAVMLFLGFGWSPWVFVVLVPFTLVAGYMQYLHWQMVEVCLRVCRAHEDGLQNSRKLWYVREQLDKR